MMSVSKVKVRACAIVGTGASERISPNQCITSFDGLQEDNCRQGTFHVNHQGRYNAKKHQVLLQNAHT